MLGFTLKEQEKAISKTTEKTIKLKYINNAMNKKQSLKKKAPVAILLSLLTATPMSLSAQMVLTQFNTVTR